MKKLILISILTFASFAAQARGGGGSNALSIEAYGRTAANYTLNFDHEFGSMLALGVGGSYNNGVTTIPVYLNIYFGSGQGVYFTAGDTFYSTTGTATVLHPSDLNVGLGWEYRSGFLFRLAVYYTNYQVLRGGLSLGFTF